ncbi:MAG: carboxypeptidase regulatory-like domain-containing protein [Ignavibacteria bacterium]|nr:carboxypeptidase regulatory-like domain-containing protein [Ignavibacteria bacterium]
MKKLNRFMVLLFAVCLSGILYAQVPAPANLAVVQEGGTQWVDAKLTWTAPTGVTGVKYTVYRKDGAVADTGAFKKYTSGIYQTNFVDQWVTRGKTYSYYVVATKGTQNSPNSDTVQLAVTEIQYGYIAGTVTKEGAATPLVKAYVKVIPLDWNAGPVDGLSAQTDSLGNFKVKVLPGKFTLYYSAEGMVPEYYNDKASFDLADTLAVAANETKTASAALAAIAPPAAPVNLTAVAVSQGNHIGIKLAWATAKHWSDVTYIVYRKDGGLNDTAAYKKYDWGFMDTTYNDNWVVRGKVYSYYVVAAKGNLVSDPSNKVEASVAPLAYATIYGKVTNETSGAPIVKARVQVLAATSAGTPAEGCALYTDSLGNYKAKVAVGTYVVYFSATGMISEYYDNQATLQTANKIAVVANDSVAANAALGTFVPPPTYYVSGKVTNNANVAMRANVTVFKLRSNTFQYYANAARTDSLGGYKIKVKKGDTLVVFAQPLDYNYLPQYYNLKKTFAEADRVVVADNVTDINFVLEHKPVYPNGISGAVKDSAGLGIAAHVSAYKLKATGQVEKTYAVLADTLGVYSFTNLLPGKYILRVVPMNDYRATYFRYDGTQAQDRKKADSVMVDSAVVVNNINFVVAPRTSSGHGHITGTVKNLSREVINGAFMYALDQNGQVASYAITDKNGNYEIADLAPGMYSVVSDILGYKQYVAVDVSIDYVANSEKVLAVTVTPETYGTNAVIDSKVPTSFVLNQNYPNPFNPTTTISYAIPEKMHVRLAVYDMLGREVAVLVDQDQSAQNYRVEFNAAKLSSGIYFYKLDAGKYSVTKKLTLMK